MVVKEETEIGNSIKEIEAESNKMENDEKNCEENSSATDDDFNTDDGEESDEDNVSEFENLIYFLNIFIYHSIKRYEIPIRKLKFFRAIGFLKIQFHSIITNSNQ